MEGARAMGASKIIGVDVNPAKLAKGIKQNFGKLYMFGTML